MKKYFSLVVLILLIAGCQPACCECRTELTKFSTKLESIHTDLLLAGIAEKVPTKCNNIECECENCVCSECKCTLDPQVAPEPDPVRTVAGVPIDEYLQGYKCDVTYTGTASIDERLIRCGLTVQEIVALTDAEKQKVYSTYWNKQPAMAAPKKRWECKNGRCYLR